MTIVSVNNAEPHVKNYLRQKRHPHPDNIEYYCQFRSWYVFGKNKDSVEFFCFSQRFIRRNIFATIVLISLFVASMIFGILNQNFYIMGGMAAVSFSYVIYLLCMYKKYKPKEEELILSGDVVVVDKEYINED